MRKFHIKRDDMVMVLGGEDKGKSGKVIAVLRDDERCIVEGIHMIKKHLRKSQLHPNGTIAEREGTLHISKVMRLEEFNRRRAKHGQEPKTK